MDQPTFTNLTGRSLDSAQSARFTTAADLAVDQLGELLGWPLDPSDYGNQFIETGKVPNSDDELNWFCSNAALDAIDEENLVLDAPDAVIGKTRLFNFHHSDKYLAIDPATVVSSVKIVRDGVTYRTFDDDDYDVIWIPGKARFTKYLRLRSCQFCNRYCWHPYFYQPTGFQLAVDATWAFQSDVSHDSSVPLELQKVLADLIWDELDTKSKDIKSESITSHSYTRADRQDPTDVHSKTLMKYVGPNGTAKRPRLV